MATQIEWCDETWNPVTGCTKVSPGCAHCYAERITVRFGGKPFLPGQAEIKLHPDRLSKPLTWKKPRMVFVNSMSDLFHEEVPLEFIAEVWQTMAAAGEHTFQILTKRAERMREVVQWITENVTYPLPNVWLGVSAENQRWADERIPLLLDTPAAVRFVSAEPLLGPIDFRCGCGALGTNCPKGDSLSEGLDWVIVGGESGPKARQMDPEWPRLLRDQCQTAGIPFFFKQWGGPTPKSGGRELDGRTWDEMPRVG